MDAARREGSSVLGRGEGRGEGLVHFQKLPLKSRPPGEAVSSLSRSRPKTPKLSARWNRPLTLLRLGMFTSER